MAKVPRANRKLRSLTALSLGEANADHGGNMSNGRILRLVIRLAIVVGMILPVLPVEAAAQPTRDEFVRSMDAQVADLLRQLDSNVRSERIEAEAALVELGPRVLEKLPKEAAVAASVGAALRRVRQMLEEQAARNALLASRVELDGPKTLAMLLTEVAKQTGNAVRSEQLKPNQRSVVLSKLPAEFWPLMDAARLQSKCRLRFDANLAAFKFEPFAPVSLGEDYFGAFRVSVRSVSRRPLLGEAKQDRIRVRFAIAAEPRLKPLFLRKASSDCSLSAKVGELIRMSPGSHTEFPFGSSGLEVETHEDFLAPHDSVNDELSFAGRVTVVVGLHGRPLSFSQVKAGVMQRRGQLEVEIERATWTSPDAAVRLRVSYGSDGPAFESHRSWIYRNVARIVSRDGETVIAGVPAIDRVAGGNAIVSYRFRLPEESDLNAWRMEFAAPSFILEAPVEFQIGGLKAESKRP